MPRLAVFNSKGGVGKTTSVLNLGVAARGDGRGVLAIDLDPKAHLTRTADLQVREAADSLFGFFHDGRPLDALVRPWGSVGLLVPAHGKLIEADALFGKGPDALGMLREGLDAMAGASGASCASLVLMDCCPDNGVLSLNAIFAADALLIPVSTDYLSMQAAFQITQALHALEPALKKRVPRAYLLTRFDRRRRMSYDVQEQLAQAFGAELCATTIIENAAVAESPAQHQDVHAHQPQSAGARNYLALYKELQERGFV